MQEAENHKRNNFADDEVDWLDASEQKLGDAVFFFFGHGDDEAIAEYTDKDIKEDERKSWASHAAENFALVDDAIIFMVENCTIKSERALNYNEVAWVDILKCCS